MELTNSNSSPKGFQVPWKIIFQFCAQKSWETNHLYSPCIDHYLPCPLPHSGKIGEWASVQCSSLPLIMHGNNFAKIEKTDSTDHNFRGSCFTSLQFSKCHMRLIYINWQGETFLWSIYSVCTKPKPLLKTKILIFRKPSHWIQKVLISLK